MGEPWKQRWKASSSTHEIIRDLTANHHPHLVDIVDDIVVVFKDKASRKGDRPILGTTAKAPAILSVLGEREYQFVLTIGNDCWVKLNEAQRTALIDHLLCFIGGKEDEKTGEMKYFMQTPDVFYFSEEESRHGNWRADVEYPSNKKDDGDKDTADSNVELV